MRRSYSSGRVPPRAGKEHSYSYYGAAVPTHAIPPFAITAVSQTEGTTAGGTVITVTANGIVGTPSSTLGAVSNVTATTFQIATTTAAHAAGSVSWTATNGNLQTSAPQTYKYLGAPTFTTATPNNGPQTLITAGVVMGGTKLPRCWLGVPRHVHRGRQRVHRDRPQQRHFVLVHRSHGPASSGTDEDDRRDRRRRRRRRRAARTRGRYNRAALEDISRNKRFDVGAARAPSADWQFRQRRDGVRCSLPRRCLRR